MKHRFKSFLNGEIVKYIRRAVSKQYKARPTGKNEWKYVERPIMSKKNKNFKENENGNTASQNLWGVVKVVLRGIFIAINA